MLDGSSAARRIRRLKPPLSVTVASVKAPPRDAERARKLAPYAKVPVEVRWLVEEYRVSVFAQELGTSEPVSAKKLDEAIAAVRGDGKPAKGKEPEKAPPAVARMDARPGKPQPVKSLGSIDRLFTR